MIYSYDNVVFVGAVFCDSMCNIYRKAQALGTISIAAISFGFSYGHLSGMVRSLQKQEDGIILGTGQISIIATSMLFCTTFGIALLAPCGDKLGRRWTLTAFSIPMLLSWILVYYGTTFKTLLISRILAGISAGGISILNLVSAAEFSSPKHRGLFQSFISLVTPSIGTTLGHALGVVVNWKTLSITGMVMSILHIFLPLICVESPQWLASKGRFDECKTAFRLLHGCDPVSENELRLLIEMESKSKMAGKKNSFKMLLRAMKKRYFWSVMLTGCFIFIYYAAAGKVLFVNLATVILEEMIGTADVLVYTLFVDVFILIGSCLSCFLINRLSLRVLLFSSGVLSVFLLLVFSACLYFKNNEVYFQWINVILLAFYFIVVHAGPYAAMEVIISELFPLDIKLSCFLLCAPILAATVCTSILLLPLLVNVMGYHGMFLLNAGVSSICLAYFWMKLPETKGKTLQEIEVFFKMDDFDVDKVLRDEQVQSFV